MGKIPVSDLKHLAHKNDLTHVIVLAHDVDGTTDHVATYGCTLEQCSEAADFGNRLKEALGWPESLRAQPPRVVALQERVQELEAELEKLKRSVTIGWRGDVETLRSLIDELLDHLPNSIHPDDESWGWCWDELGGDAQDAVVGIRMKARAYLDSTMAGALAEEELEP